MNIIIKRLSQIRDSFGNEHLTVRLVVCKSGKDDSLTVSERARFLVAINKEVEALMLDWDAFVLRVSYRKWGLSIRKLR